MKNSLRSLDSLKNMRSLLVHRIEVLEMRLARRAYALSAREVAAINARIQEFANMLADVNDRITDIDFNSFHVSYPVARKAQATRKVKLAYAPVA